MTVKEEYEKEFREIFCQEGKIKEHLGVLASLPDLPNWAFLFPPDIIGPGQFRIDIPFDMKRLKELRLLLGDEWRFDSAHHCDDGDDVRIYGHVNADIKLHVVLRSDSEGATCTRVQVGEKVVPIYRVDCGDEALDE